MFDDMQVFTLLGKGLLVSVIAREGIFGSMAANAGEVGAALVHWIVALICLAVLSFTSKSGGRKGKRNR